MSVNDSPPPLENSVFIVEESASQERGRLDCRLRLIQQRRDHTAHYDRLFFEVASG
jgi:hypothetical protein